jgi:Terminase large subunit, T4likevirus-type, N-terminal
MKSVKLDYNPRVWQKECHKRKKRFTVLALHRRAGKTELAIMELIDHAVKFKKDLGLFCYIAPFLKQAKIIAWSRLKQRVEPLRIAGAVDVNEGELQVVFKHNGAIIRIFGADNPDAMRGVRLDGIVIDEVAQIKPELWVDIVQPALSDRLGWAIFIGTPSGINLFSELYYKANDLPDWHAARFTVYDTGALDEKEVERLRKEMPEASFAREYLCDFSASGEDQLISLSDTEAAAKRVVPERDYLSQPKILGVDPARFGDDRSVIIKRQGLYCYEPLIYKGIDNMDLAARVATVIDQWVPDAVFVDAGAGAGVIDRLRQLGYSVIEVPFGGRALRPDLYTNRRAEMWVEMASWIRVGQIPDLIALKQELATPVFWFDSQNRKTLESKDEIKKRLQGAGSPDIADALALTFASPVRSASSPDEMFRKKPNNKREYDPYIGLM